MNAKSLNSRYDYSHCISSVFAWILESLVQEMMGSMKRKNVPFFFSLVTEYCPELTLNSLTLKLQGLLAAEKLAHPLLKLLVNKAERQHLDLLFPQVNRTHTHYSKME